MFFGRKKKKVSDDVAPSILGLRIGCSFELDELFLRLINSDFFAENIAATHIIKSAGIVDLDGTKIYRFYSDDDAFLQVIAENGTGDDSVVDVKLFHYYDTLDCANDTEWNALLKSKIGTKTYTLAGQVFNRVWKSTSDYHQPVAMQEKTYEQEGAPSITDQFTMLFERSVGGDNYESLFLSAEETEHNNQLSRCFVISTGMTLRPSDFKIHG